MAKTKKVERPLSPHIFIYKPIWTMMLSIIHRATGAALYVGTALLVYWLIALATSAEAFESASWFMGSPFGLFIMFGYTWAMFHHMGGGIKHLAWDIGKGFELDTVEIVAKIATIVPLVLTVLVWAIGLTII
ncbi:MAG: succinate dehydrogenase, cytochrome b556 subunit [Rhizobiales bacterium]|nr:succinate dehydrogenase, cytochrome b556 subunit [Hyphomicrobiales bacterium]